MLVLGCTNGASLGGGGGVSVGLSVTPVSIRDTQQALLTISLKNTGDENTKPTIDFYGLDESEWDEIESLSVGTLYATNKEIGYTAEEKELSFFLKRDEDNGQLPKGQVFAFEPRVRVCYDYETTATSKIDVYSKEEFYREMPQERSISTKQTKSPLKVSIDSKQPLISGDALILDVTLTNTGGGTVTNERCNATEFTSLNTVESFVIEVNGDECTTDTSNIILKKGQSTQLTIECGEIKTDNPKETKDIELAIEYTYYTDAKTTLLVEGTSEITIEPSKEEIEEPTAQNTIYLTETLEEISCNDEDPIYHLALLDIFVETGTIYVRYQDITNGGQIEKDTIALKKTLTLNGIELKLLDIHISNNQAEIQIICP